MNQLVIYIVGWEMQLKNVHIMTHIHLFRISLDMTAVAQLVVDM
jgi:hypothetical protein